MIKYYNINGQLVEKNQATVHVNDLGLIRGYGVFDYFLIESGQPLFIDDYVERFINSTNLMQLDLGLDQKSLKEKIFELIDANAVEDAGMRLVCTGGLSDDCYSPVEPSFMMMMYPVGGFSASKYIEGARLISVDYQRDFPEVKTTNYTMGIKVLKEVKKAGAVEVLYHDGSFVRESVRANIFIVTKDERIITPGNKILRGITRKQTTKVASKYFPLEEREVSVNELKEAKEVFITSSTKRIMPVVQIDDYQIGNGQPGAVTKKLGSLFRASVENYLQSTKVS